MKVKLFISLFPILLLAGCLPVRYTLRDKVVGQLLDAQNQAITNVPVVLCEYQKAHGSLIYVCSKAITRKTNFRGDFQFPPKTKWTVNFLGGEGYCWHNPACDIPYEVFACMKDKVIFEEASPLKNEEEKLVFSNSKSAERLKRIAQRNPRRLWRGKLANRDITSMPFEDSPRLAAGSFKINLNQDPQKLANAQSICSQFAK